jgi:hypothetical protein
MVAENVSLEDGLDPDLIYIVYIDPVFISKSMVESVRLNEPLPAKSK